MEPSKLVVLKAPADVAVLGDAHAQMFVPVELARFLWQRLIQKHGQPPMKIKCLQHRSLRNQACLRENSHRGGHNEFQREGGVCIVDFHY